MNTGSIADQKKSVKVAESDFLDCLGKYSRKKTRTGLVELLVKGKDKFARQFGSGRSMELVVADANHALKMHGSSSNVSVTAADMTEAMGGEEALMTIVRDGQERRNAAKAKRDMKKADKNRVHPH
jgi:hypothetical protein